MRTAQWVGVAACLSLALVPLAAAAQSSGQNQQTSQSQPQLPVISQQIEVVATKLPEAPHDAPAGVEVIGGDELRDRGATTLRDALAIAAGTEIAPGGDNGPAGSVPEFWGLREFDAFLLVVDDIPWGGAFNPALTTLSLRDVERIEILRGPAPVSYGATSFVGVIHVVHKAAAARTTYASARGGSLGSASAGIDFAIPSFGDWNSRATADFERQGFQQDRTSYTRGHALYRMSKSEGESRTWFFGDANILKQDPQSPTPRAGTMLSDAVAVDSNQNPADSFLDENRFTAAYGMIRPAFGGGSWMFTASYARTDRKIFRGFLTEIDNVPDNATGFGENIGINDIYADWHFVWPVKPHVQLVAGGDFLHGNGEGSGAKFEYTVPLGGSPAPVVAEPTDFNLGAEGRREFAGGYTLAEWKPNERVTIQAGIRLNVTFAEGDEGKPKDQVQTGPKVEEGRTDVRPGGSVGAIFSVWEQGADHVRVYAAYRDTYKPAAFDFGLGEGQETPEQEAAKRLLKPETARSVEGGVKIRMMDGRMDVEAEGFRMNFNNLVTATVVGGLPALMNTGKTRFQGFEIATDLRMAYATALRATYSFHDSKFVDFVQDFDGVSTQLAGNRFEMSPRHLLGLGIWVAPQEGLIGSVSVKYTGDRYLDKRNRALADGFATVDVGAGYRFGQYEARVDVRNATDRRDPISESEFGDAQYYRLFGREVTFGIGVKF